MVYTPPDVVDKKVSGFISADKSGNLGPLFLAEILDVALLSIISVMIYLYYARDKRTTREERIVVGVVYTIGLGTSLLSMVFTYDFFVRNFGSYYLLFAVKYQAPYLFLTPLEVAICQLHLAHRAFRQYNRSWLLLIGLSFLAVSAYVTAVYFFTQVIAVGNAFVKVTRNIKIGQRVWLGFTAGADVAITATTGYYLARHRAEEFNANAPWHQRILRVIFYVQAIPPLLAIVQISKSTLRFPNMFIGGKLYLLGLLYSFASRPTASSAPSDDGGSTDGMTERGADKAHSVEKIDLETGARA